MFGVQAARGIAGALLTGIFLAEELGESKLPKRISIGSQFTAQLKSVVFTILYTQVLSYIILEIISVLSGGLRVGKKEDENSLDIALHNKQGYYKDK